MTRRLCLVALIALSGCASVGETMQTKPPSAVFTSGRSPTEYRDCIVQSSAFPEFSITPRDEGFLFVHLKASGQIIQVMPDPTGSAVTVWGMLGTRRTARGCA